MNSKQIIATIIVLLILAAAGIGVYVFVIVKNTPVQTPVTDQNSIDTSVNIPNPTQTQAPTAVEQSLATAYDALFATLNAEKVKFTAVTSGAGEIGSVYTLYAADVAFAKKSFPKLISFPINIALVDLNKDNVSEAVVLENLPNSCGSSGCPLDVYIKTNGKWTLIYTGLSGPTVGVGSTYANGYADLFMPISGDVGYQSKIVRYSWDGSKYAPNGVVATWDGSQFIQ